MWNGQQIFGHAVNHNWRRNAIFPRMLTASPPGLATTLDYIACCDEYTGHLFFQMENLQWTTGPLPQVMQLRKDRLSLMDGLSFMFLMHDAFFRSHEDLAVRQREEEQGSWTSVPLWKLSLLTGHGHMNDRIQGMERILESSGQHFHCQWNFRETQRLPRSHREVAVKQKTETPTVALWLSSSRHKAVSPLSFWSRQVQELLWRAIQ